MDERPGALKISEFQYQPQRPAEERRRVCRNFAMSFYHQKTKMSLKGLQNVHDILSRFALC